VATAPGDALLDKLRDRDAVVRCQAARDIGTARLRSGVRELIQVLADDASAPVRRAAAESLGKIGDATARGPLERALRIEREDTVKGAIAVALSHLGAASGDYPGIVPVSEE
jgi:HEAT repeat protein